MLHDICYAAATTPEIALRKLTLLLEHRASVNNMNGKGESVLGAPSQHPTRAICCARGIGLR